MTIDSTLEQRNKLQRIFVTRFPFMTPEEAEEVAEYFHSKSVLAFPCEAGRIVYVIIDGRIVEKQIFRYEVYSKDVIWADLSEPGNPCKGMMTVGDEAFGKKVFSSRKKAEAALLEIERRKKENGNT